MRHQPLLDLFVVSWLVLFLELACIRWFPAHVLFLSFFTNTVLLACFVGMSIGLLRARDRRDFILLSPLLLAVALAAGLITDMFSHKLMHVLAPADQTANAEVIFFGAETNAVLQKDYYVPVEVVAAVFFALIASVMVGPGQEMGRALNRVPSRSLAYSVNLLGSLAGIASFAAISYYEVPPVAWFGLAALGIAVFALRSKAEPAAGGESPSTSRRRSWALVFLTLATLLTLPTSGVGLGWHTPTETYWSPYYRIDYEPKVRFIGTNRIGHQVMISRDEALLAGYALPFLFARDVPQADPQHGAWPPFQRILIIGAGSGNDLSRAIQWCPDGAVIDAVEIDPVIQRLGQERHPDRPYDVEFSRRHFGKNLTVNVHINDGRNFLRRAEAGSYDLVVFALVDSLVLHSGHSNIRLENFLFTREAFEDVKRVLKPTGLLVLYNYFRQGWLVARIREMLREVFGADPVVLTAPPKDRVELTKADYDAFTAFFAGSAEVLDPLKRAFASCGNSYWLAFKAPPGPSSPFGFQRDQPQEGPPPLPADRLREDVRHLPENWGRLRMTEVEESHGRLPPATDDWPFLYVKTPMIPGHTWRGMALTLVTSVVVWLVFARWGSTALPMASAQDSPSPSEPNGGQLGLIVRSFFLGAGFMLVETKAVVHMALLFGSTWMVNTVVFAAVLVMALAGNMLAATLKPRSLTLFYAGLFASLGAGLVIPLGTFLGLERLPQIVGSCLLVFAPIAFAGVVFAGSFRRTTQPDRMFGANIIGALIGGLAENTSMLLGFQYLLAVAAGFYLLSALFGNRTTDTLPNKNEV